MGERVSVGDEEVVIDPLVLFERALVIADIADITKKEIFETELSLYPPSLFGTNGLLRSADDKANLTDYIALECKPLSTSDDKKNCKLKDQYLTWAHYFELKYVSKRVIHIVKYLKRVLIYTPNPVSFPCVFLTIILLCRCSQSIVTCLGKCKHYLSHMRAIYLRCGTDNCLKQGKISISYQ